MQIVREDLWKARALPGMVVVTTNAAINAGGQLVMGRGAALEATRKIPGIAAECAERLIDEFDGIHLPEYGYLTIRSPRREGKLGFGIFQVKRVWSDDASMSLIQTSARILTAYANTNPDVAIRMNFPGIGNGRLDRKDVEPHLYILPDNVTICIK